METLSIDGLASAAADLEAIRDCFDVAYIFAFLAKFSPLLEECLWPSSITQFERALLRQSPPVEASEQDLSPDEFEATLIPILQWLSDANVSDASRSKAPKWFTFINTRANEFVFSIHNSLNEKWQGWNKLLVLQDEALQQDPPVKLNTQTVFWMLSWQDKVHLLKALVDYTLANSQLVRTEIHDYYNLGGQKMARRDEWDNELVIAQIGRDANKFTYWRIDDSARVYRSGNPYKLPCVWKTVSTTAEELSALAESLSTPASPSRDSQKQRNSPDGPAVEAQLKRHLLKKVIPLLHEGEDRLALLADKRAEMQKEREREIQREIQKAEKAERAARPALPPPDRPLRETRGAAKRVDYHDIENGLSVWGRHRDGQPANDMDERRRSKRSRSGSELWGGEPAEAAPTRTSSRLRQPEASTSGSNLRASRRLRGSITADEDDPVALVRAYESAQQNGNTGENETDLPDRKLPLGANPGDYDLNEPDDYFVYSNGRQKLIKGSQTALAEMAAERSATSDVLMVGQYSPAKVNGQSEDSNFEKKAENDDARHLSDNTEPTTTADMDFAENA